MTKFIKLIERYNDKEIPIIVNVSYISAIKKGNAGKDTMIQIVSSDTKNTYYFVKESVDEIWAMMNGNNDAGVKAILKSATYLGD